MNDNKTLFPLSDIIEKENQPIFPILKPRLKVAIRNQVEVQIGTLDDYIAEDHKVRHVLNFVEQLDLSQILGKIKSIKSGPGAPAIDPKILLALWLYAFIEGIISARTINRYCKEHSAFKWLCGGVSVNEHTISDFRTIHGEAFSDLLTQSIGVLSHQGLITIDRVAQDGMKVRAHCGKSSFRRETTLKMHLKMAKEHVDFLAKSEHNSNDISKQAAAARKRVAEESVKKTAMAIQELHKVRNQKAVEAKKKGRSFTQKDKDDVRASKTDPQARNMKMPNSGFNPAYNVQFASESKSKAIIGVTVTQSGHDYGQLGPMQKQIYERYGVYAKEMLVDPGYLNYDDIDDAAQHSRIYTPCSTVKTDKKSFLNEMKERMETEEAKEIYKDRAATAEFVNARTRTRGLTQFLVTGLGKVQVVATLFAIGNNMLVWMSNQ